MHFVNIYSYVFYCEKTIAFMHLVRYYKYKFSSTELTVAPVRTDIKHQYLSTTPKRPTCEMGRFLFLLLLLFARSQPAGTSAKRNTTYARWSTLGIEMITRPNNTLFRIRKQWR